MIADCHFLINAGLEGLLITCNQGDETDGAGSTYGTQMYTKFA
jgi:hypothetical protein